MIKKMITKLFDFLKNYSIKNLLLIVTLIDLQIFLIYKISVYYFDTIINYSYLFIFIVGLIILLNITLIYKFNFDNRINHIKKIYYQKVKFVVSLLLIVLFINLFYQLINQIILSIRYNTLMIIDFKLFDDTIINIVLLSILIIFNCIVNITLSDIDNTIKSDKLDYQNINLYNDDLLYIDIINPINKLYDDTIDKYKNQNIIKLKKLYNYKKLIDKTLLYNKIKIDNLKSIKKLINDNIGININTNLIDIIVVYYGYPNIKNMDTNKTIKNILMIIDYKNNIFYYHKSLYQYFNTLLSIKLCINDKLKIF